MGSDSTCSSDSRDRECNTCSAGAATAVYAIRVIHCKQHHSRKHPNHGNSVLLFKEENDFMSLVSQLQLEFPELDFDLEIFDVSNGGTRIVHNDDDDEEEEDICCNKQERHNCKVKAKPVDDIDHSERLSDFLKTILSMPEVIGSKAVAEFFASNSTSSSPTLTAPITKNDNTDTDTTHISINSIHNYFFEDDDSSFIQIDLSRKGLDSSSFLHRESISNESYLLWQFTVEQGFGIGSTHPIQFRVVVAEDKDICGLSSPDADNTKINGFRIVHERDVRWCTRADGAYIEGLYQWKSTSEVKSCSNEVIRNGEVCLYFVNQNTTRQVRIFLKTMIIPKNVYEVAQLAANEQSELDQRKNKAPLLREILQSTAESDPITVQVELVQDAENVDYQHHSNEYNSIRKFKQAADREILARLKADKKVLFLQKELDQMRHDLKRASAERRVFILSRKTIQEEVSKMNRLLQEEKIAHRDTQESLETFKSERALLKEEISSLNKAILSQREIMLIRKELDSKEAEHKTAIQTILELNERIKKLEDDKESLGKEIREERSKAREITLHSKAEVEEARMMQRILEGKVRELEKSITGFNKNVNGDKSIGGLRMNKGGQSAIDKDERLKQQLESLKARHVKLKELMKSDPNNENNANLVQKIEDAIQDIVARTSKRL